MQPRPTTRVSSDVSEDANKSNACFASGHAIVGLRDDCKLFPKEADDPRGDLPLVVGGRAGVDGGGAKPVFNGTFGT